MKKITIIGAGKVGSQLAKILFQKGFFIQQVFSRKLANARSVAEQVGAESVNNLAEIKGESELYIIAIKDDVIAHVAQQLPNLQGLVTHTSGAVSSEVLQHFPNYGIFYPLQTFTKEKAVEWEQLPFCIHANTASNRQNLLQIAQTITQKTYLINDKERAFLHVSAVFANNFTNHLLAISEELCQSHQVPFEVLRPLLMETFAKIQHQSPKDVQTGPAIREDQQTIEKHLQYLAERPDYQKIYILLTESIQKMYLPNL